jgi:regulator of nonsense transcripts 2
MDSATVFKVLDVLLPKDAGLWGRVVHLPHVPAHVESAGAFPTARAMQSDKEPMSDGPSDCNRLRCVCALLDTCGSFFCKGSAKRKLDMFLVYLMRYLYCKALSVDMDFALADTLQLLRPNLVRPSSYADACNAVKRLEDTLAEDPRRGEMLAHELLAHKSAVAAAEEDVTVAEEEDDDDEDLKRGEEEDDECDEDMEAELEEVERQLRELEMEEKEGAEQAEEEAAYVARPRREATREEQESFDRDFDAMMTSNREKPRAVVKESVNIPLTLLRSSGVEQQAHLPPPLRPMPLHALARAR